jgi:AcrR family transcriptional regulator
MLANTLSILFVGIMNIPISLETQPSLTPAVRRGRPAASREKIVYMKERITQEARKLFLTEGYRAVSIRRIASGVGCASMTLYGYYPSKIDILRHIWGELFEALFADLNRISSQMIPLADRLNAVSIAYVEYWLKNPDHYRMVFMSEGVSQPEVSIFVNNDAISAHYHLFYVLLTAATSATGNEAILRSEGLICALNGVAHSLITISGYDWSESHRLVSIIVNGFLASDK